MGASKRLWEAAVERVIECYCHDQNEAKFRESMRRLGFDEGDIDDHLSTLKTEAEE